MSKEKDLEVEEKELLEEAREQTLANIIILSFICIVFYKVISGTF